MADGGGWKGQVPSFCWKPPTRLAWVSTGYLTHGPRGASPCQEVPLTTPSDLPAFFRRGKLRPGPTRLTLSPWRPFPGVPCL